MGDELLAWESSLRSHIRSLQASWASLTLAHHVLGQRLALVCNSYELGVWLHDHGNPLHDLLYAQALSRISCDIAQLCIAAQARDALNPLLQL